MSIQSFFLARQQFNPGGLIIEIKMLGEVLKVNLIMGLQIK